MASIKKKTGIEEVSSNVAWSAEIWVGLKVTDLCRETAGNRFTFTMTDVKSTCAEYVYDAGWCVSVRPVNYQYTSGEEDGAVVGAIAYPRFKTEESELRKKTMALARKLLVDLKQTFVTVVIRSEEGDENVMLADWDRYNINQRNRTDSA